MIRDLSLGQRIGLGFLLIGLLVLLSSGLGLVFASSVTRTIDATQSGLQQFADLSQLERTWADVAATVDKMLLTRQTSGAIEEELNTAVTDFNQYLADLAAQPGLNERDRATVETLALLGAQLTEQVNEITAVARDGRWSRAQVIRHTEMNSLQRRFDENLALYRNNLQNDIEAAMSASIATQNTLRLLWIGTVILAVIVGSIASVRVMRSITRPVDALIEQTRRVTQRDFREITPLPNRDEVGELSRAIAEMTHLLRESYGELEQRVADRTRALLTSAQVSRQLTTILEPEHLINEVVAQIDSAFKYYHTHIYLFDENKQYLLMVGGTGEAGREMLARGHKIERGKGLVGRAAASGVAVFVPDVTQAEDWLPNPLLPDTQVETAVPIQIGQDILGVLDVQHNVSDGLKQEDVDLLQSIANQVAIALRNAQLYAESEKRAQREAQIRAINESILNTSDIEIALQVAEQELKWAFGTTQRIVRLTAPESVALGGGESFLSAPPTSEGNLLLRQPLRMGSEVVGELAIGADATYNLIDAQVITAVVADQLGQHLEKLRLSAITKQALSDAQRRSYELTILNSFITNLSAADSLHESMQILVDEVAAATQVKQTRIALFDEATNHLVVVAEHHDANKSPSALGKIIPLDGNDLTQQVMTTRQSCYVPDARKSPLTHSIRDLLAEQGIFALAILPIVISGQVAGTLGIDVLEENRNLSPEQLHLAEAIVIQGAAAIDRAQLFEQTETRAKELAVINEVAQVVSQQLDQQNLLLTVHEQIRRIMPVDAYFVALHDEEVSMVEFPLVYDNGRVYQEPLSPFNPDGNIAKVIASNQALLINRTPEEIDEVMVGQASAMIGDQQKPSASLLYVPLRIGQEMLGVLSVQSYEFNAYTPANTTLLLGIANHVAVALDNARLLAQSQKDTRRAQILRDISGSINTTLDAESILQTAVREIGRSLGLQTYVYLNTPDMNGHSQTASAEEGHSQPA